MERYFSKKPRFKEPSSTSTAEVRVIDSIEEPSHLGSESPEKRSFQPNKKMSHNFDFSTLPSDPGLRYRIIDYHPNDREEVRRYYYQNPCRPRQHNFKKSIFSGKWRRFNPSWFDDFSWITCGDQGGGDAFMSEGFTNWKKDKIRDHAECQSHFDAYQKCMNLLNEEQHIGTCIVKKPEKKKVDYRLRLCSSIKCIKWLLIHGLPFRGHDESLDSSNRGLFLDLLQFLADNNEEVSKVVLENSPGNTKMTSSLVQKQIVNVIACDTTNLIMNELGGGLFAILIDEARDVSTKEQMAAVLRYVDKRGCVVERFFGLKKVGSTTAKSLKNALDALFFTHSLSISMLRGQGYDGASNMQGEYNGLKALILKENESAHYIHCFAHQLQLALIAVAKKHILITGLFKKISDIVNTVGGSCKKQDMIRENHAARIVEALLNEEIPSGRGLNQEMGLVRPGDTRWGSHFKTLVSLVTLFDTVVDVLDVIAVDGTSTDTKFDASQLLQSIQTFEFVFTLHLMKTVLGITEALSRTLQRKDQDIENAMRLVDVSKNKLQKMRDDEWNFLVTKVSVFCEKHFIPIPCMDDMYVVTGRSRRRAEEMTNTHHYRFELFNTVIDMQLAELNHRFYETNTELLLCISALSPEDKFIKFKIPKLIQLAQFYPKDFSPFQLLVLENQLETFFMDMQSHVPTQPLKGLSDVTGLMVESKRDSVFPLVYKLYTLALILPVATATVERAFSGMKIVKNRLRNKMGDQWLNDSLVVFIEKDLCKSLSNDVIMSRFQGMAPLEGNCRLNR